MFSLFNKNQTIITDEKKIDELLTRGVEEVIHTKDLRKKLLSGKRLRIKLGIDPTSPNLHLGRAVPLLKLRDFQELGHKIILIIGDGTGVVGDTSDKDSERPMLTKSDIEKNMETYFDQAGLILDINKVEKKKNSEWLHKLTYVEIGEHANQFSVADFIARENIKKRLDSGKRVSLREILYPLMQGYDSVAIKADVELGGTDQRFNLLAGRELQEYFGQEKQSIVMTPLIDGTDGRKMSSSWGNTVNLTESPEEMYGKIMSINDEMMRMYFINLTRISMEEIEKITSGLEKPKQSFLETKMYLAHSIVSLFHNKKSADKAQDQFINKFQKKGIPSEVRRISGGDSLLDALLEGGAVESKTDFRRLIEAGAITNKTTDKKITDINELADKGVYKIGKHRFVEIE